MVATDLDGTLLRRHGSLSPRTVAAVRAAAAAGIVVVLVTARPPRWVDDIVASLGCHPVAVCSNGALVYDAAARELIAQYPIEPQVAAEVVRRLSSELDGVVLAVEAGMRYGQEPGYPAQWPIPADALLAEAERLIAEPVAKLIVRHAEVGDHWELIERARRVVGDLVEVTSSATGGPIELAAPGVSKAFALEFLADRFGIGRQLVLAVGDMPNDLPMLGWAGRSVAPANAHPDVLAMVDQVTQDCDADGVATVIEDLIGQEPESRAG